MTRHEHPPAADALAELERRLARAVYRFACPSPHALGEYTLDLLGPAERLSVAQHLLDCQACADELAGLRHYLATEPPWPAGRLDQARRRLARLVGAAGGSLAPSPAGLRAAAATPVAVWRVEDLSISLIRGPGERDVSGLVARDVVGPEGLADATVHLLAADGSRHTATIGPAGDFSVADVLPGDFDLELPLADGVVLVSGVQYDRL